LLTHLKYRHGYGSECPVAILVNDKVSDRGEDEDRD